MFRKEKSIGVPMESGPSFSCPLESEDLAVSDCKAMSAKAVSRPVPSFQRLQQRIECHAGNIPRPGLAEQPAMESPTQQGPGPPDQALQQEFSLPVHRLQLVQPGLQRRIVLLEQQSRPRCSGD